MQIVQIARTYIGKKEKPGNTGFVDPIMEAELKAVGWQAGWAWCAGLLEVIVWKAYPEQKEKVKGLFVPSAVNTYRNLLRAGYKSSLDAEVGSLVFWQRIKEGVPQWTGHCGVVVSVTNSKTFKSVEGNTNGAGSREGDGVYEKPREVRSDIQDGLKVLGFIKL